MISLKVFYCKIIQKCLWPTPLIILIIAHGNLGLSSKLSCCCCFFLSYYLCSTLAKLKQLSLGTCKLLRKVPSITCHQVTNIYHVLFIISAVDELVFWKLKFLTNNFFVGIFFNQTCKRNPRKELGGRSWFARRVYIMKAENTWRKMFNAVVDWSPQTVCLLGVSWDTSSTDITNRPHSHTTNVCTPTHLLNADNTEGRFCSILTFFGLHCTNFDFDSTFRVTH